jgi:hypothetical protein
MMATLLFPHIPELYGILPRLCFCCLEAEPDRLLYAGLIIGLTQDARGYIGSASEDLQVVLQQHRAMFSSKRQDFFASDATFKKDGATTQGRPREKRLISNTEKARMMKASSNRGKTHQACSFCKMNGCRVSNCLVVLEPSPWSPSMLQILLQMHLEIPPSTWWRLHKQSFCSLRLGSKDWITHPHQLEHTTWY